MRLPDEWDYLIVTASNEKQADWYRSQLALRRELGCILGFDNVLVVPDPEGKRIGSCSSTLLCLIEVLRREGFRAPSDAQSSRAAEHILENLRILIIHSGGDSRRLPGYSACGKIFVPLPLQGDGPLQPTLFDKQLPVYQALPGPRFGGGQVVITAGDVLMLFDPRQLEFLQEGITGVGGLSLPTEASHHGVFCPGKAGLVRRFLQKPSVEEQRRRGAIDRYGRSLLDTGVFVFDASFAAKLLELCGFSSDRGRLRWSEDFEQRTFSHPVDFYREICCALGSEASFEDYLETVRCAGSTCDDAELRRIFACVSSTPFGVASLSQCDFLHFGTNQGIIESGYELVHAERRASPRDTCLFINSRLTGDGRLRGHDSWVEGCCITGPVELGGQNLLVGADVSRPLTLAQGRCVDVVPIVDTDGSTSWCVRCYAVDDAFKETDRRRITFCGKPLDQWIHLAGARKEDLWERRSAAAQGDLWNARLFPVVADPSSFSDWLWMFEPEAATPSQKEQWKRARRHSFAEILDRTDLDAFVSRRKQFIRHDLFESRQRLFHPSSSFSAHELAYLLRDDGDRSAAIASMIEEGYWQSAHALDGSGGGTFVLARILHSIGTALELLGSGRSLPIGQLTDDLSHLLGPEVLQWLQELGIVLDTTASPSLSDQLRAAAIQAVGSTIIASGRLPNRSPRSSLRSDEIVWGRAPARLDLGGGWSDTPPYSLEHGGCVLNAAVNLNGQPPIQAYARVVAEPRIRIRSIDLGDQIDITRLSALNDYRNPTSSFGLAKAAFILSGFSREAFGLAENDDLPRMLEMFGGGIEMTTFAAIPKGSGLGTSSIMGAVILAVIQRILGNELSRRDLFNSVLRLEQALSTGGGWQDQIGGVVEGVKKVTTAPGLVPEAEIHHVPSDVLDPRKNGGQTLLYYTGITRLAKNILQKVVGRYLDRERSAVRTLGHIHAIPHQCGDAMSRKDMKNFGELIDVSWRLNKQLDPESSNEPVEQLLAMLRPHILGAKLLGAGGGGFLLVVCKSVDDAVQVQRLLTKHPPNDRARFFGFDVSTEGLVVTVS